MSLKQKVMRGGALLLVTQVGGLSLSLLRLIILARFMTTEQYGVAMALLLSFTTVEMLTQVSLDRFIMVSKPGDEDDKLMRTMQTLSVVRGLVGMLTLLALAKPITLLFNMEYALDAFLVVSLAPLLRGMLNLDIIRQQRDHRQRAYAFSELGGQTLGFITTYPAVLYFGDYWAMVAVLLMQWVGWVLMSYWLSERPMRFGFDRTIAKAVYNYGWPLLINALFMILILQGDRFAVGTFFSASELGIYGAIYTLVVTPASVFVRIASMLLMPLLAQSEGVQRAKRYNLAFTAGLATSVVIVGFYTLFGEPVMALVYGEKYAAGSALVLAGLSLAWAFRICGAVSVSMLLATHRTKENMWVNILRSVFILPVIGIGFIGLPLPYIALGCLIGDAVSLVMMNRLAVNGYLEGRYWLANQAGVLAILLTTTLLTLMLY